MMGTEMDPEMSTVFNEVTWMIALENVIIFINPCHI